MQLTGEYDDLAVLNVLFARIHRPIVALVFEDHPPIAHESEFAIVRIHQFLSNKNTRLLF
jgi:hypothetical protein